MGPCSPAWKRTLRAVELGCRVGLEAWVDPQTCLTWGRELEMRRADGSSHQWGPAGGPSGGLGELGWVLSTRIPVSLVTWSSRPDLVQVCRSGGRKGSPAHRRWPRGSLGLAQAEGVCGSCAAEGSAPAVTHLVVHSQASWSACGNVTLLDPGAGRGAWVRVKDGQDGRLVPEGAKPGRRCPRIPRNRWKQANLHPAPTTPGLSPPFQRYKAGCLSELP